jgi:hypothetical protein
MVERPDGSYLLAEIFGDDHLEVESPNFTKAIDWPAISAEPLYDRDVS